MKRLAFLLPLALAACQSNNNNGGITNAADTKVVIAPPIPALDIAFTKFEADAGTENQLKMPNGTLISIPANSLTDDKGNKVTGKIEVQYREMHDAADILLSGIPMNYEAQGKTRTMQTAGMFELRAYQNGQAINIAPDAAVSVKMASYETGSDYNFFYLDENKGWEFIDYVTPEANASKVQVKIKKPEMPFPLTKEYFCFDYMGILDVVFEKDLSQAYANQDNPAEGEKAKKYGLSWLKVPGHYYITFEGVKQPSSLLVWKRLSAAEFPAWFAKEQKYDSWQLEQKSGNVYTLTANSTDGKTFSAQIQAVMPIKALFKFPPDYWEKNYEAGMEKMREEQKRLRLQADAFRSFEISGFGIYNYDKLMNEEDRVVVKAEFKAEQQNNELYEMDFVFYLPEDNKTVVKLPRRDWDKVALLPNNAARFLTILPNGGIGLYSAKQYQQIDFDALRQQPTPNYTFDLVKTIDKLESADQLKTVLDIF